MGEHLQGVLGVGLASRQKQRPGEILEIEVVLNDEVPELLFLQGPFPDFAEEGVAEDGLPDFFCSLFSVFPGISVEPSVFLSSYVVAGGGNHGKWVRVHSNRTRRDNPGGLTAPA